MHSALTAVPPPTVQPRRLDTNTWTYTAGGLGAPAAHQAALAAATDDPKAFVYMRARHHIDNSVCVNPYAVQVVPRELVQQDDYYMLSAQAVTHVHLVTAWDTALVLLCGVATNDSVPLYVYVCDHVNRSLCYAGRVHSHALATVAARGASVSQAAHYSLL